MNIIISILLSILLCATAQAKPAYVVRVIDGDTIAVMMDGAQTKIRLYGVDCPEKKMPFGPEAKAFTSAEVAGKVVDVSPVAIDRYGRTVASVTINGRSLGADLVVAGLAWVYPPYCKQAICRDWWSMQATAEANHIGLWTEPQPTPPWIWRKNHK